MFYSVFGAFFFFKFNVLRGEIYRFDTQIYRFDTQIYRFDTQIYRFDTQRYRDLLNGMVLVIYRHMDCGIF